MYIKAFDIVFSCSLKVCIVNSFGRPNRDSNSNEDGGTGMSYYCIREIGVI